MTRSWACPDFGHQITHSSSPVVRESDVLRGLRERDRKSGDTSLSYIEYTSERESCADQMCTHLNGTDGCQIDDETSWTPWWATAQTQTNTHGDT